MDDAAGNPGVGSFRTTVPTEVLQKEQAGKTVCLSIGVRAISSIASDLQNSSCLRTWKRVPHQPDNYPQVR